VTRRSRSKSRVLGPAVVGGGFEPAVQVDDRVADQSGRVPVRLAPAQAGEALHWHTVGVGRLRGDGSGDWERALQLVPPLDRDRLPAPDLDRRARNHPSEAPDARHGKVAVKAVRSGADADRQPAVMLRREQA
jgi:hypothetical protein